MPPAQDVMPSGPVGRKGERGCPTSLHYRQPQSVSYWVLFREYIVVVPCDRITGTAPERASPIRTLHVPARG
jgi:hypothetical protein